MTIFIISLFVYCLSVALLILSNRKSGWETPFFVVIFPAVNTLVAVVYILVLIVALISTLYSKIASSWSFNRLRIKLYKFARYVEGREKFEKKAGGIKFKVGDTVEYQDGIKLQVAHVRHHESCFWIKLFIKGRATSIWCDTSLGGLDHAD